MERIFMTDKMRQARHDIGVTLTKQEILLASDEIYERLRADILIAEKNPGRDYIHQIPERKVGKSYNLMRLAAETGYLVVVHSSTWADYMRRDAKKHGWNIDVVSFRSIPLRIDGTHCFIMLKDEMVDIVELRNRLNESKLGYVSVVGIN